MKIHLVLLSCLVTLACARDPAPADEPDAGAISPSAGAEPAPDAAAGEDDGPLADPAPEADASPPDEAPDEAPEEAAEPDAGTEDESPVDADDRPLSPTFAALFAEVFEPANCANAYCHPGAHGHGFDARTFGHWLLTAEATHMPCSEDPRPLVVPGDPDGSLLYLKVAPGLEVCGAKMPNLDTTGAGLPAEQAERVRAWIADGARL